MSRYTWILDPGHGGLGPGWEYLTPGKRSPEVPPGIHEGEFNRDICRMIVDMLPDAITTTVTNPGPVNAGLIARLQYIRALQKVRGNCVLLSVHANAARGKGWSGANGAVVFHHPKNKSGKVLADQMIEALDENTSLSVDRGIKTARFAMLTSGVPSILVECGFMTNPIEAEYLASSGGRQCIADSFYDLIQYFEINGGL